MILHIFRITRRLKHSAVANVAVHGVFSSFLNNADCLFIAVFRLLVRVSPCCSTWDETVPWMKVEEIEEE